MNLPLYPKAEQFLTFDDGKGHRWKPEFDVGAFIEVFETIGLDLRAEVERDAAALCERIVAEPMLVYTLLHCACRYQLATATDDIMGAKFVDHMRSLSPETFARAVAAVFVALSKAFDQCERLRFFANHMSEFVLRVDGTWNESGTV